MKQILEYIKKNREMVLWVVAIVLVSILLVWSLLSTRQSDPDTKTLIDTPLLAEDTHTVTIPKALYDTKVELPRSLEVYTVKTNDQNQVVESFLVNIGKESLVKTSTQGIFYRWGKGDEYAEYVTNYQSLTFEFSSPAAMQISSNVTSADDGEAILSSIYSRYFDKDYNFTNVTVSPEGRRVRIEGNRLINGYPLNLPSHETFSDYVIIDDSGNLYKGKLSLVDYDMDSGKEIDLVHPSNLSSALKDELYPKEIFQGYVQQIGDLTKNEEPPRDSDAHNEDVIPQATISMAKEISVVYYFSNISIKELSPVYRIEATGEIVYQGKTISVPLIIFTNALDPARVYIQE